MFVLVFVFVFVFVVVGLMFKFEHVLSDYMLYVLYIADAKLCFPQSPCL